MTLRTVVLICPTSTKRNEPAAVVRKNADPARMVWVQTRILMRWNSLMPGQPDKELRTKS